MTSTKVLAAGTWRTNGQLIADVARLHFPIDRKQGFVVLDATYGDGGWWTDYKPPCLLTNDLYKPAMYNFDFTNMRHVTVDERNAGKRGRLYGLHPNTVDVVAFDPPYVSKGGRETSTIDQMDDAYGMAAAPSSPKALQRTLIEPGMAECHHLLKKRGLLLVKCMDYVSSGRLQCHTMWTYDFAVAKLGMRVLDRFIHVGKPGPQPKKNLDGSERRQVHAANNASTLFVFQKKR